MRLKQLLAVRRAAPDAAMRRRLRATADEPRSSPDLGAHHPAGDAWERAGPWAASSQVLTFTLPLPLPLPLPLDPAPTPSLNPPLPLP